MRILGVLALVLGVAFAAADGASAQTVVPKTPSKMSSILEQMVEAARSSWDVDEDRSEYSNALVSVSPAGEMNVVIHSANPIGTAEKEALAALGVRIQAEIEQAPGVVLPPIGMIDVWVPCDRMRAVEQLDWVTAMTPAGTAVVSAGPVQTEGVAIQGAQLAQAAGITGEGTSVGIVSNGVTSLAMSQARGELGQVRVLQAGRGDEGTAMLEIVHDVAPGAALLFAATGATAVTHQNALMRLMQAGANVITEDIGFLDQPVFAKGMLSVVGDQIAAAGVSVHSAAGNQGDTHAARVAAVGSGRGPDGVTGPFIGCGQEPPTNAVPIAPNGDNTFDVVLGSDSRFFLQWSEPRAVFPTAGQGGFTDLDLYIMDSTGRRCLARSTGMQGGGRGDTFEAAATPAAMAGQRAKIVVNQFGTPAANPPILDLLWVNTQQTVDTPTREGSLSPDANYTGLATTSAALRPLDMPGQLGLEPFSSGGPVQFGLTTLGDGSRGPGPQNMDVVAPTFASVDGVSISGVGGFPSPQVCPAAQSGRCRFFGTSASAPQSAACAALVLQSLGRGAGVADVNQRLSSTALDDMVMPGPDNIVGFGLIDCASAPIGVVMAPAGPPMAPPAPAAP